MKCEYLIVSFAAQFIGSAVTVYAPDGSETREDDNVALVLNRLAAQGWEAVSRTGDHALNWTLKRAI